MKANIRYFKKAEPRINISVDERDVWSLETTISYLIIPLLEKFRDMPKMGVPFAILEKARTNLGLAEEQWTDELEVETQRLWTETIDEIMFGFKYNINCPSLGIPYYWEDGYEMIQADPNDESKGHYLEPKGDKAAHEEFMKQQQEYGKRAQKSVELFAEYFFNLWV